MHHLVVLPARVLPVLDVNHQRQVEFESLDGIEQIESLLDTDGDGLLTTDDILGTVATLVNDCDSLDQGLDMIDGLFCNTDSDDSVSDMPDYVSDADTLGLV